MKRIYPLLSLAVAIVMTTACNNQTKNRAETGEAKEVQTITGDQSFPIDSTNSTIEWTGSKPTGKHNGTIEISEGEMLVTDGKLVGGKFVIDMNSIRNLDLTSKDDNAKLVGHLKSADFFEVEKYPTSIFVITSVQEQAQNPNYYNVTGNLTLKENTASITFPVNVTINEDRVQVRSEEFVIDRSNWNVRYGSRKFFDNLRDNYISDDIALKINIDAKR